MQKRLDSSTDLNLQERITKFEEKEKEAEFQIESLKNSCSKLQALKEEQERQLTKNLNELEELNNTQSLKIVELEEKIVELRQGSKILTGNLLSLNFEFRKAKSALETKLAASTPDGLSQKVHDLEALKVLLDNQILELENQLNDSETQRKTLTRNIASLSVGSKSRIYNMEMKVAEYESNYNDVKLQLERNLTKQAGLQSGFNNLREDLRKKDSAIRELKDSLSAAKYEVASMEESLKNAMVEKNEAMMRIADLELGGSESPSRANLIDMSPLEIAEANLIKSQESELSLAQNLSTAKNDAFKWELRFVECDKRRRVEADEAKNRVTLLSAQLKESDSNQRNLLIETKKILFSLENKLKDSEKQKNVLEFLVDQFRVRNLDSAANFLSLQAIYHATSSLLTEEITRREINSKNKILNLELALQAKPVEAEAKRNEFEVAFDNIVAKSMLSLADIKSLPDVQLAQENNQEALEQISSLQMQLNDTEKKIEILEGLLAVYQERRLEAAAEFESYQSTQAAILAVLQDKISNAAIDLENQYAKHILEVEWFKADISQLNSQLVEKNNSISTQNSEIQKLNTMVSQLKSSVVAKESEYSLKCSEVANGQSEIANLKNDVDNLGKGLDLKIAEAQAFKEETAQLNFVISEKEKEGEIKLFQITEMKSLIMQLEKDVGGRTVSLGEVQERLKKAQIEILRLKSDIQELELRSAEKLFLLEESKERLESAQNEKSQLKLEYAMQSSQLDKMKESLDTAEADKLHLQNIVESQGLELSKQSALVDDLNSQALQLRSAYEICKSKFEELNSSISESSSESAKLVNENNLFQVAQLNSKLDESNAEVTLLHSLLATKAKDVSEQTSIIAQLQSEISIVRSSMSLEISDIKSSLLQSNTRYAQEDEQKRTLQSEITQLQNDINALQIKILERDTEVENLGLETFGLKDCLDKASADSSQRVLEYASFQNEIKELKAVIEESAFQTEKYKMAVEEQRGIIANINSENKSDNTHSGELIARHQNVQSPSEVFLGKTLELIFKGQESLLLLFPEFASQDFTEKQ